LKKISAPSLWLLPALALTTVLTSGCNLLYTPPKSPAPDASVVLEQSIFRGLLVTHQTVNGYAVAQDDMILGEADRMEPATADALAARSDLVATASDSFRWPNGQVPYAFEDGFPYTAVAQAAVSHWNTKMTGVLHFVPRTDEADYIVFSPSDRCASYLGMVGGPQPIWVGPNCGVGDVIHQIGHAMGAMHEENRLDRDQHVRIHWENLATSSISRFDKTGNSQGTDVGSYDYASIMHAPALVASTNGSPTIETIPAGTAIGQATGLSDGDVANLTALYSPDQLIVHPPIIFARAPTITTQPQDAFVEKGDTATFAVTVTGSPVIRFQWYKDGIALIGQQAAQLTLPNVQTNQSGYYWVRASNDIGTTESQHALLSVGSITPPPGHGGNGSLTRGVPVTISAGQGQQLLYTFDVPQGATQLVISIADGNYGHGYGFGYSGDADLYVRFGSPPTLNQYDCRPYIDGSNETCRFPTPLAGTYYVMVNGYTAFSNVQLLADYTDGVPPPVVTAPIIYGQPQSATVQVGANAYFWVSAGGQGPLTYQWYVNGQLLQLQNGPSLSLTNVQPNQSGSYYVVVSNSGGSTQSVAAVLTVNVPPPPPPPNNGAIPLTNNVPFSGLSGLVGSQQLFSFQVPAGARYLSFRMFGGSGDADLFTRYGAPPDAYNYDCVSQGGTNNESCNSQYPLGGTYYVLVRGYSNFSGATLVASYSYQSVVPPPQQSITLTGIFYPPPYGDPFDSSVQLNWTPVSGAEYYAVYRNGEWIGTTYGDLSYVDQFIPSNYQAAYQVFAIYGQQRVASSNVVLLSLGWPY
jgi:astacin